ncbi:MAG: SDR family oxidoreductase [Dehalococcoidia bacterium]|nr:SDR family oxidoreductase [Dehalococcoidia bacterium]
MGTLDGKVTVITGSGRGIGQGMAKLFAREGAKVVVNDPGVNVDGTSHDNGPADQTVAVIKAAGGQAVANYDSVATAEGGERMIKQAVDTWGRIDVLCNVAGILRDRMIFNMTPEEWRAVLDVHLTGQFHTIRPASVQMRQQRNGRIINFSSSTGLFGNVGQANYGAAKSAVAGLTRMIARDLGGYGVTANVIAPSASTRLTASVGDQTSLLASIAGQPEAATRPQAERTSGWGAAMGGPEYIAPMCAYLASDEAWDINGQVFHVVGGRVSLGVHPTPRRTIVKHGLWTLAELDDAVQYVLMRGIHNPQPPRDDVEVPGRNTPARALA